MLALVRLGGMGIKQTNQTWVHVREVISNIHMSSSGEPISVVTGALSGQ